MAVKTHGLEQSSTVLLAWYKASVNSMYLLTRWISERLQALVLLLSLQKVLAARPVRARLLGDRNVILSHEVAGKSKAQSNKPNNV